MNDAGDADDPGSTDTSDDSGSADSGPTDSSSADAAADSSRGSSHLGLPATALAAGALLWASAFLPLTGDGLSFWNMFLLLLRADPASALVFGFALGAPFLFGLAVAIGGAMAGRSGGMDRLARSTVHTLLALLHAELVVVAGMVLRGGGHTGLGAVLLGFGIVSGVYFAYRSARAAAEAIDDAERLPSMWWMARWGSSVIVVLGAWLRLLSVFGARFGIALDLATLSALGLATSLHLARFRAAPIRVPVEPDEPSDPHDPG